MPNQKEWNQEEIRNLKQFNERCRKTKETSGKTIKTNKCGPTSVEKKYNIDQMEYLYFIKGLSLDYCAKAYNEEFGTSICGATVGRCLKLRGCILRTKEESIKLSTENGFFKKPSPSHEQQLRRFKSCLVYHDVPLEFLQQFDDFPKLKLLHKTISNAHGAGKKKIQNDEDYMNALEKFYYDPIFNYQYDLYLETGSTWDKPSLDHIVPLSKGGSWDLDNLHIMSWYDNHCKCDLLWNDYLSQMDAASPGAKEHLIQKYKIDENGQPLPPEQSGAFSLPGAAERIARNKELVALIQGHKA